MPCLRSIMPSWTMALRHSYLVHRVLILCLVNGSSNINFTQMVRWLGTRLVRLFEAILSVSVLILMHETFSLIVKPTTIRVVLSIASTQRWPIHQLDVKNVFLHVTLDETVYCQQPSGFVDPEHPDHVCLLLKSLYGLKQARRAWYQRFATHIRSSGFTSSVSNTSLFILQQRI